MSRNKSVDTHQFAMIPRAEIPRSKFRMETSHKTTFDAGYLIPVYLDEVLPGDTFSVQMTAFARLSTPIVPIMDNLILESFFFFVPNRLVWTNWVKFMGEQANPSDSISFTVPTTTSPAGGFAILSLFDYMGLPCAGQTAVGNTITVNSLPLRCYHLIWNTWFRDENLQTSESIGGGGDGPDASGAFKLLRRGKRHDYFTSCLPWVQKGTSVPLPLAGNAAVLPTGTDHTTGAYTWGVKWRNSASGALPGAIAPYSISTTGFGNLGTAGGTSTTTVYPANLYADLSTATATTINQLRQSFQIQKLLERDARGGTRYTEIVRSHFGVISPDARLQRPEYLGGGSANISVSAVPQSTATGLTGGTTPLGFLAGIGTMRAHGHGFSQSFTEHGYILGLVSIRADLSYQQGLRKLWSRSTRYDFYFPVFAMLGEQAVLNQEIYSDGSGTDIAVFGYQERWAEYRYHPSQITGLFKSTSAGTLDVWHLSQKFLAVPTLNATFIADLPPVDRILAVPTPAGKQFLFDSFIVKKCARPMPMYSVPGLIDHF